MKIPFDYNPITKVTTTYVEQAGQIHIAKTGDVELHLDWAKSLANDPDYTQDGIKKGMWHYAHIPAIVMDQMLKHGINPYAAGSAKAVFKWINENAPHLKTTAKRHG
jgi:hypothetical protein